MRFFKTDIAVDKEWNEFLFLNYDLFFDYSFLKYNDEFKKGINWHHIKIKDDNKNKIISILTGCDVIEDEKKQFISCNGTSFGGFKWRNRTSLIDKIAVLKEFTAYLKESGFDECILRNPPNIYKKTFNEEYEYALIESGFEVSSCSITNVINLNNFAFDKLANPKKRSINKSEKRIIVNKLDNPLTEDNFYPYYKVLLEDRLKKNVVPTHTLDELVFLKNSIPERIQIFYAEIENHIAGICILFLVRNDIILNFYLAADEEFKKDRVSDFILYKSIEWARQSNFKLYDIGTSNIGKTFLPGLFDFKKKFMADGFLRKTFKFKI